MKMSRIYTIISLLFIAVSGIGAQDRMQIDDFNVAPGKSRQINVALTNSASYTGFQADIELPNNLTLSTTDGEAEISLTSRADDTHMLVTNQLSEKLWRVVCFSIENIPFNGTEGELMNIKISTTQQFAGGEIVLKNIIFTNEQNQDVVFENTTATVGVHEQNTLSVSPLQITQEGEYEVTISLNNDTEFTAFQTEIILPSELTIIDGSFKLTDRATTSHKLSTQLFGNNKARVVVNSMSNATINNCKGAILTFKVEPQSGVTKEGEIVLQNNYFSDASANEYKLPNTSATVIISTSVKYTVSVSATQGGTAEASATEVEEGATVTLTATPTSNAYRFVNWTVNGKVVSTENPYTATVTAKTEFVANFEVLPTSGKFEAVNSDGVTIWYNITSYNTAEVTYKGSSYTEYSGEYSGEVNIPSTVEYSGNTYSVTAIGEYAFYYCKGLMSVTIPEGVTTIGDGAFQDCDGLTSVTIPESVTTIGYLAFDSCDRLTSVVIPESVTTIGDLAFDSCDRLTEIEVAEGNINYSSEDGVLFNKDKTKLIQYPIGNSRTSYYIPEGVTTIGACAFDNCDGLTSVTIPESVTSIGNRAFSSCDGLTSVTIPEGVTSIGNSAFSSCDRLTSVTIPESVTAIGRYAFEDCDGLTEIYSLNPVAPTIYSNTFYTVSKTIPVYIPKGSLSSYQSAEYWSEFTNFVEIKEIYTISVSSSDESMGSATASATEVEEGAAVTLTATPNDGYKFTNWTLGGEVVSTENPYTATVTANSNFVANFEVLPTSGKFEAVNSDGVTIWYNITSYNTVEVTYKGSSSSEYSGEYSGEVNIPSTVEYSGNTYSVTTIGEDAFSNCAGLTSVTIPEGVTSIEEYAFIGCTGLTSVVIPEGVTSIGDRAFYYCGGLTSVVIPEGVKSIGYHAFEDCVGLTNVTIPESVTSIGSSAFYNCTGLTEIEVAEGNINYSSEDGVLFNKDKTKLIQYPIGNSRTSYSIPEGVTSIEEYAFLACKGLTSVTIPESVTSIGKYAFSYCRRLTSVVIPEGVTSIGEDAFSDCDGLTSVTIPNSVTAIGNYAFSDCDGLTSVVISEGVTTIGEDAFLNCTGLTEIEVAEGNINYSSEDGVLFNKDKTKLIQYPIGNSRTSYSIPEGVTTIGESAFSGCKGLTSVTIPNSVTTIGASAFEDCYGLTSVTIPESVTSIGKYAFYNCTGLTEIYSLNPTAPDITSTTFGKVSKTIPVYIPKGSLSSYQSAQGWREFTNFVEIKEIYTISVSSSDETMGTAEASATKVVNEGEVTLTATPNSCFKFINWTVNGEVVSTENPYTATVTADTEFVANFEEFIPEYVDLGLPSGIKWATCNVGATTPEGYGDYFAWGETEPKDNYYWDSYKYCNGSSSTMTKYCTNSSNGTVDNKTVLELEDDAAYVNWGGNWRMPTYDEISELKNTNNCTWEWTRQNGVNGYKVTSVVNGNSIFLPATGYRYNVSLSNAGSYGSYWSSSLVTSSSYYAYNVSFNSSYVGWGNYFRDLGLSVRAVWKPVYTVSVSATEGGTVEASATEVENGEEVTLTATPAPGYAFVNWTVNGEVVSTENPYTATVTADTEFVANFEEFIPEYVDLGLPSGIKWATCNVGATSPEGYGNYFAWGETKPKTAYDWSTYKYCNGSNTTMTKYCTDSSYGTIDNKTVLELDDDVARVIWGGNWRMPTRAEEDELRDTNNCTWTWTTQNGVNGYKVTSNVNGNFIFLPAAGYRYYDSIYDAGTYGFYWSSSLFKSNSYSACYLDFGSVKMDWAYNSRFYGLSVRAVSAPLYLVSVSATEGGEAEASSTEVEGGAVVTLTATPAPGYNFVNWTVNGEVVSTENPYIATVTATTEYVANFEEGEKSELNVNKTNSSSEATVVVKTDAPATIKVGDDTYTATEENNLTVIITIGTTQSQDVKIETIGGQITSVDCIDNTNVEKLPASVTEVTLRNVEASEVVLDAPSLEKITIVSDASEKVAKVSTKSNLSQGVQVVVEKEINTPKPRPGMGTPTIFNFLSMPFDFNTDSIKYWDLDSCKWMPAVLESNIRILMYKSNLRANKDYKNTWETLKSAREIHANQGFVVVGSNKYGDKVNYKMILKFTSSPKAYDGSVTSVTANRYRKSSGDTYVGDKDWNFNGVPFLTSGKYPDDYTLYTYDNINLGWVEHIPALGLPTLQPYSSVMYQAQIEGMDMTKDIAIASSSVLNEVKATDDVFARAYISIDDTNPAKIVLSDESSENFVVNEDAWYMGSLNNTTAEAYFNIQGSEAKVTVQPAASELAMTVYTGVGTEHRITLTAVDGNYDVYLRDVATDKVVCLNDEDYTFTAAAKTTIANRFVVSMVELTGICDQAKADGTIKAVVAGDVIKLYGTEEGEQISLYTASGMVITNAVAEDGVTTIATSATGVVIIKVADEIVRVVK